MVYQFYSTAPIVNSSIICSITPEKSTMLRNLIKTLPFIIHSLEVPLVERDYPQAYLEHSNYVKTIESVPSEYTNRTNQGLFHAYKYNIFPLPNLNKSFLKVGPPRHTNYTLTAGTFGTSNLDSLVYLDTNNGALSDQNGTWKSKHALNYVKASPLTYSYKDDSLDASVIYKTTSKDTSIEVKVDKIHTLK